ncbi:MAG TPA: MBG domain-containing protein [Verrucomicrobiae bacterium]
MGSSGATQTVIVDSSLNDCWATAPNLSSARWVAPTGQQIPTWTFATAPLDPNEPPEGPTNGSIQGQGHAAALLPFAPPPGSFRISADVTPVAESSDWVALGFTSSGAVSDNFVSLGRIWMRLDGHGRYEVLSYDVFANTNSVRVSGTTTLTGFNALRLAYDPATGMVSGAVNGVAFPPFLTFSASGIAFAGVEAHNAGAGAQVVDHFQVEVVPPAGPRSELFVASKSERGGGKTQIDVLQGPADHRSWLTEHGSELALAVNDTVRMVGMLNLPAPGDKAAEYTLAGVYTGTDYSFPVNSSIPMQFLDGATDGAHNYAWDFNNNEAWQFDLNWANPAKLFSLGAPSVTGAQRAGITYDPSNNSFWLAGYSNNVGTGFIENRSLDGTLLGFFITPHVRNRSLALDPADGTLWVSYLDLLGSLQNYSRTGEYLGGHYYPELVGMNVLGAEFRSGPVAPVNHPPVAIAQTVATLENTAVAITLAGTDIDGDALTFAVATGPSHGTLNGTAPTLTYTPAGNYHGPDSFAFTANDGVLASSPATISLTVTPVNHAPQVANPLFSPAATYGAAFNYQFPDTAFSDPDNDPLTYMASGMPAGITFVGATRTFSGAPTQVGAFPVAVVAIDNGTPNLSATNTFTIMVNPASVTGGFTAADKVYDGSTSATVLTRMLGGVLAADAGNVSLTGGTASFSNANVAVGITVALAEATLTGSAAVNYVLGSVATTTASITPATLVVSADDKTKVVGAADPPFTATYAGFVNGETTNVLSGTISLTREPGEAVGSYAITPSGPTNANYAITFLPGALTITAPATSPVMLPLTFSGADLVITWSAVSNVTYRVQYKTDLSAPDWTDLPGDVTAAGTTASKTDVGTNNKVFYRVRVLP